MTQAIASSPSSDVVRLMTPTETAYHGNCTTMVASLFGAGTVDVAALERAFAALRAEYPTLAGLSRPAPEGYEMVLLENPGPGSVRVREASPALPPVGREAVVAPEVDFSYLDLAVERGDPGRFCLSLGVYHGAYDGHAVSKVLVRRLVEQYDAIVRTGETLDFKPYPILESSEALLHRQGVLQSEVVSGLEEAFQSAPVFPVTDVPSGERPRQVRLVFSEEETSQLRSVGKSRGVSMSAIVTAVVVAAIYNCLGRPAELVVPVLSVVAIRDRLDPPVPATEGTVMLGNAGAVVAATGASDPIDLGAQVSRKLAQELDAGIVQQSGLHLPKLLGAHAVLPAEAGPASKFFIGISNMGLVEEYVSPQGLQIDDFQGYSANLCAEDFGKPELGITTRHNYWFLAITYGGRLSLVFKVRDAGTAPDAELALVKSLRAAAGRIIAGGVTI